MSNISIEFAEDLNDNVFYKNGEIEQTEPQVFEKLVCELFDKILMEHDCISSQLNVVFCSNEYIHELNRKFRGIDKATDVLSFPFDEPDFLGEIYLSFDFLAENELMFGSTYLGEIMFLLIHGLLHLLGYTHDGDEDSQEMRSLEKQYFKDNENLYGPQKAEEYSI